jgi:pimeloyl-ACP methyl ester carboxylesterase
MTAVSTMMVETPNGVHRVRLTGEGSPLVVIPGGPGYGATYLIDSVTELLGDRHRLVFIDQRGTGASPVGTGPLSPDAYVEDTAAIVTELGLEHFDIMGHSFGGLQTVLVAAALTDRVTRVVLVDADAPTRRLFDAAFAPGTPIYQRSVASDYAEMAVISATPDWMFDQDQLNRWIILHFRAFYTDPSMSSKIPHGLDGARYLQWQETETAMRESLADWDVTELLPSISAPVLVMACRDSILGKDIPDTYERLIPNAELIWVEGGHTPPSEDPEGFATAVRSFFDANP